MDAIVVLSRRDVVDHRGFVAAASAYGLAALGLPDPDTVLRRVQVKAGGKIRVGRGKPASTVSAPFPASGNWTSAPHGWGDAECGSESPATGD
ncbi:hypothetical protein [Kitasatospora sp. NPDC059160]|uniref:hypothetical protein n=1 Tax=Kitasatospora sp. NPDC059160 TaxID=3346748 RepID=UPI003678D0B3